MKPTIVSSAFLLCTLASSTVMASPMGSHEAHYRAFSEVESPRRDAPLAKPSGDQAALNAERHVVGYFPYWSDPDYIPYESLTRLSWFMIDVDSQSNILDDHGWGGSTAQEIVDTAHSFGIEVLLTFAIFNDDRICDLVNSESNRAQFITTALELVELGEADGISVDFEMPQSHCMEGFEYLIGDLSDVFHQNGLIVDIATPAIDWNWGFDYDYLASMADSLFIMGYNYHWYGGNPGPVDPLNGGGHWGPYALDWTVEDYLDKAYARRDQIILGLPTYAIAWPASSTSVPAQATDDGWAVLWATAHDEMAQYGRQWDEPASSPYYTYTIGNQAYQVWMQDAESMTLRFDYAEAEDLGGIGFWALGYDQNDPSLWQAVDAYSGISTGDDVGDLVGYIRDTDIFEGEGIPGATVYLQNGASTETDANGYYVFEDLPAHLTYAVTAEARCYQSAHGEKYLEADATNWKSLALEPLADCGNPGGGGGCDAPETLTIQASVMGEKMPLDIPLGALMGLIVVLRMRRRGGQE